MSEEVMKQNELLKEIEGVFAKVARLKPGAHKNVLGDKWKFINPIVAFIKDREAKAKQHYKQKESCPNCEGKGYIIQEISEHRTPNEEPCGTCNGTGRVEQKGPDRPELREKNLEQWTARINAIVGILRVEMDGGFLENTAKYEDDSEDIIYNCLRAIAVNIEALIPDIEMVTVSLADMLLKAKREERERIKRIVNTPSGQVGNEASTNSVALFRKFILRRISKP